MGLSSYCRVRPLKSFHAAILFLLLVSFCSRSSVAQQTLVSMNGTVTDSSGASILGITLNAGDNGINYDFNDMLPNS